MLPLCLAYDHRVLDGADAIRFMKDIIAGLEAFDETELKLK
jgi:pyruvate/2-oxoglutarate dehydrogenase complex dihydrolipoamide acyltransferase (E2) component